MRISLDIPGGPLNIVISGYKKEPTVEHGWWTVGGRKLQVSRRNGSPWELTGYGIAAATTDREQLPLPSRAMREAFRAFLRKHYSPGEAANAFATDSSSGTGCRWGWSDCESWIYHTPNDGSGRLPAADAVAWMRQQARAVGMTITSE